MTRTLFLACAVLLALLAAGCSSGAPSDAFALDVDPEDDVVEPYEEPDVREWIQRYENEGREIYLKRLQIVEACGLRPGTDVADVGAGTGLFTVLLARAVGPAGTVQAIEIVPEFVDLIEKRAAEEGLYQVRSVLGQNRSAGLDNGSIDMAFLCDVYNYLEFPRNMLESIHDALRPGGILVLIGFVDIPGVSTEWALERVDHGRREVAGEIQAAGFELVEELPLLDESYFLRFRRVERRVR